MKKNQTVRNSHSRSSLLMFFVVVGINVIGCCVAYFYNHGAFVPLVSLGQPPVREAEFLLIAYDNDSVLNPSVYIKSDSNTLYRRTLSSCRPDLCWQSVEQLSTDHESDEATVVGQSCKIPPRLNVTLPSNLEACITLIDWTAGSLLVRYAYFMKSEDGEIWSWFFVPGQAAILIVFAFFAASIIVFIALFVAKRQL
jgi:hypothetical protein